MKAQTLGIPIFKLYGENQAWPSTDLMHCESIHQRSSLYQWEIKPHRHADLLQLLYVRRGEAVVEIEGQRIDIREPSIQVTPPLCVHGFQFGANIEGYVLTLAAPLVAQMEAQLDSPLALLATAGSYSVGAEGDFIDTLFSTLHREYESSAPSRDLMLRSLVNVLVVWISRNQQSQQPNNRDDRNNQYLAQYIRLVEQHYTEHPSVEDLAHRVGISSVHLNALCRQFVGHTALQIIHQRLLLEAKRNLTYTNMSISQLSEHLGFNDPAYFSRFFRRLTGLSPNDFRRTDGHPHALP
ncbi:helix-turn-helix domain-containing protein [Pseudomonas panipatensis]|jgi:AraC family transcriptional activator of pobA|uniref:AraC family transcriptional regulator, transcriptional activator of pobA n=1 Tax=Pseudomonas panipatensis TaxID=428992 RepID=A0A1G8DPZ2_9PSED|nr:helix-turn-helix domain-containing protein [Pseudomonas panipatensis]SDH59705.1 AraC family transcriptional regulator, transcriptional activator of pobA [Pseudomonas panipatensis]SMP40311.1 transcriptional regulator, AraC family [Pseudomonas panipatensis]